MASVLDVLVKFLADTKDIDKALGPDIAQKAEKAGTTAGSKFSNAVSKATTVAGAAGGLLFASAIEGATKFEDQLRTIQTVVPDLNLDKAGKEILDLSRETGKATDDLTAGFYDLVSAGVSADDAIGVLRESAKFATGALGSTAESVDLVTSVMNAYGLEAKDAARITDVFAKAVADGKVTAAELGGSIAQIAPIAAQAGVSMEEISAGFAVMTAKGTPAAEAATQMRAAISALLTPNEQLNKLQKQTGINFAELAKTKGLAVALNELRKATNGNNDAFARSLGSIQAYQFAIQTTGEEAESFAEQIVDTANSAGLATDQYNIKAQSAAEQGNRFAASVKAMILEFGAPFVQTLGPALQTLNLLGPAFGRSGIAAKAFGTILGGVVGKGLVPLAGKIRDGLAAAINAIPPNSIFAKFWNRVATNSVTAGLADKAGGALGKVFAAGMAKAAVVGDALSAGLSKIGSNATILRGMEGAGKLMGTTLGKALGVAAAAAAVIGVVLMADEVQKAIDKQKADLVEKAKDFARTATEEQVAGSLEGLKAEMEQNLKDAAFWNAIPLGLGAIMARAKMEGADGARQVIDAIEAELGHQRTAGAIEGALRAQRGDVDAASQDLGDAIEGGISEGSVNASRVVRVTAAEILSSINGLRNDVVAAATGAAAAMFDPIIKAAALADTEAEIARQKQIATSKKSTDEQVAEANRRLAELRKTWIVQNSELLTYGTQAEQISKTKAFLASDFWVQAYRDATPEQRAALDEWRRVLEERLKGMVDAAEEKGGNVRDRYTGEIREGKEQTDRATNRMLSGMEGIFDRAERDARKHGERTGRNFASGLSSQQVAAEKAAAKLAGAVGNYLKISSPAKMGPMSTGGGPGGWGERIGQLIAQGLEGEVDRLASTASQASSAITRAFSGPVVGPVLNPALGTLSGGAASALQRTGFPAAPAVTKIYQTTVPIQGLLKAKDEFDIATHLQRAAENGLFDWREVVGDYE